MLSVVIATLNRDKPLCNTLRYFLEFEAYPRFEVIVIDQSTRHDVQTLEFLAAWAPKMSYTRTQYQNLPRARNDGARRARGEIVVYVDDDVEPREGFLSGHSDAYADPDVLGVTGPAPVPGQPLRNREEIGEEAWAALLARRHVRFDVNFPYSAQWAIGCNMSFRRWVIGQVGGFDENFIGPAGEDAEFSHRVLKVGRIQYAPAAQLVHLKAPSGGLRDALGQARYVMQAAFDINYFWFKVEAPRRLRRRMVMRTFREQVVNRRALMSGRCFSFTLAFLRGLRDSERVIRQIGGGR
jgi:GT2 family glycosyltransferase